VMEIRLFDPARDASAAKSIREANRKRRSTTCSSCGRAYISGRRIQNLVCRLTGRRVDLSSSCMNHLDQRKQVTA
jgi:hypothetical protein